MSEVSVKAKDISVKDVITVRKDRTVASAKSLMTYFKLDALIVTEENDPVGIITINDIDRRVLSVELDPHLVCVGEAFSEPLLWVRYNTTLSEVAQIMDEKKISRLPIFGNLSSGPILLGIYVHGPSEIELEN